MAILFLILWVASSGGKKTKTTVKISTLKKLARKVKEAKNIIRKWNAAKKILFRPPKVKFSKATQFKVCARPYSKEEEIKRNELKALIDKNRLSFIRNKQQCPGKEFLCYKFYLSFTLYFLCFLNINHLMRVVCVCVCEGVRW